MSIKTRLIMNVAPAAIIAAAVLTGAVVAA
jgi:hypothetical protein